VATGVDTLISPAMLEAKGRWGETRYSPPIALSDIRRWAIAVYWPEPPPPIHWDEAYAAGTRWGGVIAPPGFNAFAWPVARSGKRRTIESAGGAARSQMNAGQTDTYGAPMRPGDVIASRSRLFDMTERQGRFGLTLYVTNELEWTNQKGEFVRRRMGTQIRF
jgi:acyl dehydratase